MCVCARRRSVTAQVLEWGQAERQGGHSSATRSAFFVFCSVSDLTYKSTGALNFEKFLSGPPRSSARPTPLLRRWHYGKSQATAAWVSGKHPSIFCYFLLICFLLGVTLWKNLFFVFSYNFFFIYLPTLKQFYVNRQLSAGSGFSCAVTWAGDVLSWGNNSHSQCGAPAELGFITHPERVPLPASASSQGFAVQVSLFLVFSFYHAHPCSAAPCLCVISEFRCEGVVCVCARARV